MRNERAWALWERLGSPQFAMAPMVDGSNLPFRAMCRSRGVQLCYSPMLSAKMLVPYVQSKRKLEPWYFTEEGDGPTLFQVSGNDPELVAQAAEYAITLGGPGVAGVDLNLGCPQHIAERSRYGAFLMEEPETVEKVVRAMAAVCRRHDVLCAVKIRILPDDESGVRTAHFCRMLEAAGADVLGVHGRTRHQKGPLSGDASWSAMAACVRAVTIPVIANGNVSSRKDAHLCMSATGAVGVMSAWGLLRDPALFLHDSPPDGRRDAELQRAFEWVAFEDAYLKRGVNVRRTKLHLFKRLQCTLKDDLVAREHLARINEREEVLPFLEALRDGTLEPFEAKTTLKPFQRPQEPDEEWDLERLFEE